MWKGIVKVVLYVGIVLIPVVLRSLLNPNSYYSIVYEIGRNFALIGFTILLLQILLAGRFQWISRTFGFDMLIRYHKYIAIFATTLLILHPLLLAYGGDRWELLISFDVAWYIWVGKGALLIVLIQIVSSLFHAVLHLTFERWRLYHDMLALLLLGVAFVHVWYAGDYVQSLPTRVFWGILLSGSLLLLLYHRWVRPVLLGRHPYRVTEVIRETPDVWTIKLAPPRGKPRFDYQPGQFQFITFQRNRELPEEEHHWTISSSPVEENKMVSSTIKELGDFTSTIGQTQPGDAAVVHAPFGRFSYTFHPDEQELVFLAGGIGITPFMSMLRHMRDTRVKQSVVLLYGNKTREDIVFYKELEQIVQGKFPRLDVIHVLEESDSDWTGETGFIDREKIIRYCGDKIIIKGWYVCGPAIFSQKVIATLLDLEVPRKRIHQEIFSLLD